MSRAGNRTVRKESVDLNAGVDPAIGGGDQEGRNIDGGRFYQGSAGAVSVGIGATPQPMPTQMDRETAMKGYPMDWDAAIDDAKAAGVKFWGDDMTTTTAKEVQVTAPVYGNGLDTTSNQNKGPANPVSRSGKP